MVARKVLAGFAVLALGVGVLASAANAPPPRDHGWTQFRFGAAHTGFNPFERTLSAGNVGGLHVKWSVPSSGENLSPPAVANGTVYQGSRGALAAFDAQTGTQRWSVPVDARFPAVSDGLVLACVFPLGLSAFDARTGSPVWSQPANCSGTGPTVTRQVVYAFTGVGPANMRIAAFRASSGAPLWTSTCPADKAPGGGAPTIAHGQAYVLCGSLTLGQPWELVTFDATTGATGWRAPLATIAINSPAAVARGLVYVASASLGINGSTPPGVIFALDARTGTPVWTATIPVPLLGFWAPAVAYGPSTCLEPMASCEPSMPTRAAVDGPHQPTFRATSTPPRWQTGSCTPLGSTASFRRLTRTPAPNCSRPP